MACFIGKNVLIKALTREVHRKGERWSISSRQTWWKEKRKQRKKSHNLFDYKWASLQSVLTNVELQLTHKVIFGSQLWGRGRNEAKIQRPSKSQRLASTLTHCPVLWNWNVHPAILVTFSIRGEALIEHWVHFPEHLPGGCRWIEA